MDCSGCSGTGPTSVGHPIEFAHPDDIALGMELLSSCKATGPGVKEPVTYRALHANGSWIDIETIVSNVEAPDGLLLVTSIRPARDRRPSTAIFGEASARVAAMFEEAAIGMAQVGLDGTVLRANRRLASLRGVEAAEMVGQPLPLVDTPLLTDLAAAGTHDGPAEVSDRIEGRDGSVHHVRVSASLVRSYRDEPLYYAVQVVDITELVHAEQELLHRARHDPLTGLANRAVLDELLDSVDPGGVAVIYLDLDGFKAVNDRHGHASGDAVLCAIAGRIRSTIRAVDVAVRLGGDEFVIACDEIDAEAAERLAQRVVDVCAEPIALDGFTTVNVGASAGVAIGGGRGLGDLLRQADRYLYDAKSAGGNRVAGRSLAWAS